MKKIKLNDAQKEIVKEALLQIYLKGTHDATAMSTELWELADGPDKSIGEVMEEFFE